jgi:hypothetical protein
MLKILLFIDGTWLYSKVEFQVKREPSMDKAGAARDVRRLEIRG